MGILAAAFQPRMRAYAPTDDYWYQPVGWNSATYSGLSVTADTALQSSPVWAAVQLLANSIAMAPVFIYRRLPDGGKERAPDHPLYELLHDSPNEWQTAYQWKSMMMVHALLWGNGYSQIEPGPRGPVDRLVPLHPDGVRVEELPNRRGIRYMVRQRDGTEQPVNDEDMFHLPGLSIDGISGLSIMRYARESIGLELAAKRHAALAFGQGTRLSGILKVKGNLSKESKDRLSESWSENKAGVNNHFKTAVLDDSADWIQTGMNNEDAQLLEQLSWSVEDTARYIGVPLHMIGHTSKETSWGTGIESIKNGYVTFSVMPWTVKWEQGISKDLIIARRAYFAEFLLDVLLRGDTLQRYQAYQIALGGNNGPGWVSPNDIRVRENMNPVPGLDEINRGPSEAPPGGSNGVGAQAADNLQLRLMVRDAAARVVRKEITVLGKAAKRTQGNPDAWAAAVDEFYADHDAYVASALRVSKLDAQSYCLEQMGALLSHGASCMDDWEPQRVDDLVKLALGGGS